MIVDKNEKNYFLRLQKKFNKKTIYPKESIPFILQSIEKKHFYKLLMQAPIGITIIINKKLELGFMNSAAEKYIEKKHTPDLTFDKFFPEETRNDIFKICLSIYKTGIEHTWHEIPQTKDFGHGIETKYFTITLQPFYLKNDLPEGLVSFSYDVSAEVLSKKNAQNAVKERDTALEALSILNALGQQLSAEFDIKKLIQVIINAATKLSNAEFGAFFYHKNNDIEDNSLPYTISGSNQNSFSPNYLLEHLFPAMVANTSIFRCSDLVQIRKDKKIMHLYDILKKNAAIKSCLCVPVFSRCGDILGGIFLTHKKTDMFSELEEELVKNLTAQAAIALDNARLYQKAQNAIAARDEFLSIAAHELKTPITTIQLQNQLNFLTYIKEGISSFNEEKIKKIIENFNNQTNKLNRLVDDMLDASRIITRKFSIELHELNISQLIQEIFERFHPQLTAVNCTIQLNITPSLIIKADAHRLEQAVTNLITNIIRYAPGVPVYVKLRRLNNMIQLKIKDNGPGISKSLQNKIFQRFEKADKNTQNSGLGLGLYITKQIIEAHKGIIKVNSEENKGTEFIIELPIK